jgi:hypothetical protein
MRFTAFIFSFYFMLIAAQPVIAGVAAYTMRCESECGSMSFQRGCAKSEESSCPTEESSCALCCCNVFQCTFCCGALVEEQAYKINLLSQSARLFPGADLILPSSYSPDCWQPPEMA